jgi:glucosamine--fructose-6-phosphate aminotransferase (isomerizing)
LDEDEIKLGRKTMTTILESEIKSQPAVIERLVKADAENVTRLVETYRRKDKPAFNYVLIAARGTSDNAARYAQYLFGIHNHMQVALATPSVFSMYRQPPDLSGALVIGISQSGQSPDIVSVISEGRRQGRPTLAITNFPDSPLAEAAEGHIQLNAGIEKATAATKTYTASLVALALFSACLSGEPTQMQDLQRLPAQMEQTLQGVAPMMKRIERYRYMEHCIVIGRGYNYSTAFEIALKIKELTSTVTEQYSPADFRHGPIAMVDKGFPVIVIAPKGPVFGDMQAMVVELKEHGAELLVISEDPALLEQAELPLPLPAGIPEWLTPMAAVLPGQLFGLALAQSRHLNADQPEGLHKITETM